MKTLIAQDVDEVMTAFSRYEKALMYLPFESLLTREEMEEAELIMQQQFAYEEQTTSTLPLRCQQKRISISNLLEYNMD